MAPQQMIFLTIKRLYTQSACYKSIMHGLLDFRCLSQEVASLSGSGGTKDVFPMKSFSNEYEPTPDVGVLILRGLQHALFAAQVLISSPL